jgi:hypothetical protein
MHSAPPGRSTLAISGIAEAGSIQCQAEATTTASTEPSGSGMRSAVPSCASASGQPARSTSIIRGSGSTA